MKIAFLASEVEPFAKTGGLADVTASLAAALGRLGHEVRIIMPLYGQVDRQQHGWQPSDLRVTARVAQTTLEGRVWDTTLPGSSVHVYGIDQAALFDRDGLYQHAGQDFPDNLTRFGFFSQAALRVLPALDWQPEVIHCHDWQTSLACAHLSLGRLSREPFFRKAATVLTVHNLAYQGVFPREQWEQTGLAEAAFSLYGLEWSGKVSCLKAGLVCAGLLTTVSPTYAREIQTPEFGCGLEEVLTGRRDELVGIVNGIDEDAWNPQADAHITARYSPAGHSGKSLCKLALQRSQGIREQHDLLIGMIQRLAEQKGIDIFTQALEPLMDLPLQIVLLGTGEPRYHEQLAQAAKRFSGRLAVNLTFDNALAHQIEAGADAFLMPSRFEPCGLNQMYSMRFGTVPIVRRVGGLADTVVDVSPSTLSSGSATGFVFDEYSAGALGEAVSRAVCAFRDYALWSRVMDAGMRQDFSWDRSAREYVKVYERALAKMGQARSRFAGSGASQAPQG